jgi:hypothetical protein
MEVEMARKRAPAAKAVRAKEMRREERREGRREGARAAVKAVATKRRRREKL